MEDIVIFPSRKKLVLIAVGAFVFIAIGVFIIRKPEIFWIVRVLGGYLGVAFSGICLGYAIFRLIKPKPSLVINDEGVFDNASAVGAGMLKWSEIDEVKISSFMGQRFLSTSPIQFVLSLLLARRKLSGMHAAGWPQFRLIE